MNLCLDEDINNNFAKKISASYENSTIWILLYWLKLFIYYTDDLFIYYTDTKLWLCYK